MDQNTRPPNTDNMDKPLPMWLIAIIPFYVAFFMGIFLFPISADWKWLEAWLFIITFSIILGIGYYFINKENPRVLRNRSKLKKEGLTALTKKSAGSDRFIIPIMSVGFFGALILPAVEHRMHESSVPFFISMIALFISNIGDVFMLLAMYQNAHASKILDINKGQKLIDTGLYGRVRHPLYTGAILMILAVPVALGSWWGLIPAAVACVSLVWRIKFEEEMLVKGMDGYMEYQQRVKYKLFPGIY